MEQDNSGDYLADYFEWDDGGQQQQYDASVAAAAAGYPQDHNQQQIQQYAAAAQPDTAGMPAAGCIPSSDLRPTDILCGRGNYSNPGNATFVAVCGTYRAEYTSCKSFREKQVVADQIYDELCRAGSGRFLQLVKGPNRKKDRANNKGGGGGSVTAEEEKTSYWKEMDRKDIGVKIKRFMGRKPAPPARCVERTTAHVKAEVEAAAAAVAAATATKPANEGAWTTDENARLAALVNLYGEREKERRSSEGEKGPAKGASQSSEHETRNALQVRGRSDRASALVW